MNIALDRKGRRTYLRGDTFSSKDAIKDAGGHWDADERAWWIGDHKRAEALLAYLVAKPLPSVASYTKLPDGSWGIRGKGLSVGDLTVVVKRDGTKKTEKVIKILRADADGYQLAEVEATSRPQPSRVLYQPSFSRGDRAPGGKSCPQCGSRECSKAWNPRDLCDDD